MATIALYLPAATLCFLVARIWNRYRGTRLHTAIEEGLRPIAAGLMTAGGVTILRVEDLGLLAWGLALTTGAILMWRPLLHPMILLFGGAAIFVAVRVVTG